MARRGRLAGEGLKSPKGASVKSRGAERLGKIPARLGSDKDQGDERERTTDEVSGT